MPPVSPAETPSCWREINPNDLPIVIAFCCVFALLLVGSLYSRNFLSPEYLLQQLKVGAFLGVIATGMTFVILLGHIDLSVPWAATTGAMLGCAASAYGPIGEAFAIPFGVLCGVAIGTVNGLGVAYLRIPSMIITLAVNAVAQGLMVAYTGGFAPQDSATSSMRLLGAESTFWFVPNAVVVWAIVGAGAAFVLGRTTFGRAVYAIGNRESVAYLSGIRTQRIVVLTFILSGGLAAFGGVLLALSLIHI